MALRLDVDLSMLDFCREDCGDDSLHPPHGARAATVTVIRATQEVFIGPAVAYQCADCRMETVSAPGRHRPRCTYCRSERTSSTQQAPGGVVCRGGEMPAGSTRGPCPTCGRVTDVICRVSTELCPGVTAACGDRRGPCVACGRVVATLQSGLLRPHRPLTQRRTWYTRVHRLHEVDTVDPVLTDVVYSAVGYHVPTAFVDIHDSAVNEYSGRVSARSTQRALAVLLAARQIVSIGCASWTPQRQRSTALSGHYLRYDSPKLWRPDGLRDLMSVVAQADEPVGPARRRAAEG